MEVVIKLVLDAHGNLQAMQASIADKNLLAGLLIQAAIQAAVGMKNGPVVVVANGPIPGIEAGVKH